MPEKLVSLALLEKAVKSQFFLLRPTDKGQVRRQRHRLECHHVEIKNPGLALIVFVGIAIEYGIEEHTISEFLQLPEKLIVRYRNYYSRNIQAATLYKNAGVRLNPESSAGKVFIKTGLVKSWLKWNG